MTASATGVPGTLPGAAGRLRTSRRTTMALASLALGGVALGTAEFASIGILPSVASSLSVSEPTAGLLVSAYALGVVIGAPVLAVLGARMPRRSLLLALMALFGLAQVGSALAPNFPVLAATRFVAGLPHGAYLGGRLADRSVLGTMTLGLVAVAAVMAGFTGLVHHRATAVLGVFLLGVICMTVMPSIQGRLLDVAPDAPTLAASVMHSATNSANAIGAWAGGLVLSAGAGYAAIGWVGAAMAIGGVILACVSARAHLYQGSLRDQDKPESRPDPTSGPGETRRSA